MRLDIVGAGVVLVLPWAAEAFGVDLPVHRHTVRPGCLTGIPAADYRHGQRSESRMRLSLTAQLIPAVLESGAAPIDLAARGSERKIVQWDTRQRSAAACPTPRRTTDYKESITQETVRVLDEAAARRQQRLRVYQLDRASLQVDHCAISRVSFQLDEDGAWALSLRGDQNVPIATSGEGESRPAQLYTGHLKRNQFFVKVRCYGRYETKEEVADQTTGKPVLFQLSPAPFWVEKGEPYDFHQRAVDDRASKYFDLVDRVEIEFYYR